MFTKNATKQEITQVNSTRLRDYPLIADMSPLVRNTYVNRVSDMLANGYTPDDAYTRAFQVARIAGHEYHKAEQIAKYAVANAVA